MRPDTNQTPAKSTSPTLSDALAEFQAKARAGDFSPMRQRLSDSERWKCFTELAQDRGSRYAACTLESFDRGVDGQKIKAWSFVNEFCKGMPSVLRVGGGLILHGPEGTGKDHLQFAALTTAIITHGYSAIWRDGLRLQKEIRKSIQDGTEFEKLRELAAPQILAISDPIPPKGDLTDYGVGTLRDLVDRRYQSGKSTWLTLNVAKLEDAEAFFTPPLLARLRQGSLEVRCNWASYRGRKP